MSGGWADAGGGGQGAGERWASEGRRDVFPATTLRAETFAELYIRTGVHAVSRRRRERSRVEVGFMHAVSGCGGGKEAKAGGTHFH